jgi:hypothetical protein
VLIDITPFLKERLGKYLSYIELSILTDTTSAKPDYTMEVDVNTVTPQVRGYFWMWAEGMVELDAKFFKGDTLLFQKKYQAVAKDGDDDVPPPPYSALTIEYAGKLVTATSIKRISDELISDICKEAGKCTSQAHHL